MQLKLGRNIVDGIVWHLHEHDGWPDSCHDYWCKTTTDVESSEEHHVTISRFYSAYVENGLLRIEYNKRRTNPSDAGKR